MGVDLSHGFRCGGVPPVVEIALASPRSQTYRVSGGAIEDFGSGDRWSALVVCEDEARIGLLGRRSAKSILVLLEKGRIIVAIRHSLSIDPILLKCLLICFLVIDVWKALCRDVLLGAEDSVYVEGAVALFLSYKSLWLRSPRCRWHTVLRQFIIFVVLFEPRLDFRLGEVRMA